MKSLTKWIAVLAAISLGLWNFTSCDADVEYKDKIVEKKAFVCPVCEQEYETAEQLKECQQSHKDVTAPAEVTDFTVNAANGEAVLTWTNPLDEDFAGIQISADPAEGTLKTPVSIEGTGFTVSGLNIGSTYTFKVKAFDKSFNFSAGVEQSALVKSTADVTPPAQVADIEVLASNGNAAITWTNPADQDFAGVQITMTPAAGTLKNAVCVGKNVTEFSATGLTNGQTYTFAIKTFDDSLNYSEAAEKAATVIDTGDYTAPAEVTDLTVKAADGRAVLSWTNPSDTDFAGVRISAEPAEGTLVNPVELKNGIQSFSVSGLKIGSSYTFKVQSFDGAGNYSTGTTKTAAVADTADHTAPVNVTNLTATNLDSAVLLEWTDPADEDLLGVQITFTPYVNAASRAVALEENAILVAPGVQAAEITNLTNGTEYTFTLKAVDLSGNFADGVTESITPSVIEKAVMTIELVPDTTTITNQNVTVSVNPVTSATVKTIKYDSGERAVSYFTSSGTEITSEKAFTVTENGTFTVFVQDSDGRREVNTITINNIDKTPPAAVTDLVSVCKAVTNKITVSWSSPADDDFSYVLLSYTKGGNAVVTDEKLTANSYTVSEVVPDGEEYVFTVKAYDAAGNVSNGKTTSVKSGIDNLDGEIESVYFHKMIPVMSESKTITGSGTEGAFIGGRTVTLSPYEMAKYQVTQKLFTEIMGTNPSEFSSDPAAGETQNLRPVETVNWYMAIAFCNKLTLALGGTTEDLVYSVEGITDWSSLNWSAIPTDSNSTWDNAAIDLTKTGYRLPTEAEWEFAARGGDTTKEDWNYTYSGSNTLDEVAWMSDSGTHQVGLKKSNRLGIYDMTGNVWEWCSDWWGNRDKVSVTDPAGPVTGKIHVSRGCGKGAIYQFNSTFRGGSEPNYTSKYIGFRVSRSIR